jgi:hypothetical protein
MRTILILPAILGAILIAVWALVAAISPPDPAMYFLNCAIATVFVLGGYFAWWRWRRRIQ